MAFPPLRPVREIDRSIREQVQDASRTEETVFYCCAHGHGTLQILDLNISVLFDYADKEYTGTVEVQSMLANEGVRRHPRCRLLPKCVCVTIIGHGLHFIAEDD